MGSKPDPSAKDFKEDLDRYSNEYLYPGAQRSVDQRVLAMLVERVVPMLEGPNILEMGYGDGVWTQRLVEKFGKSHLVDAAAELVKRTRTLFGTRVTVYQAYFEEFHAPLLFDSIVCTYVLEHVVDPVTVLNRARSWLKPDGLLFVAVPNASSLHRRLGVVMGIQGDIHELGESDISIGHRRVYDVAQLENDLKSSGFRIETAIPMMLKPLPNSLLAHLSEAQLRGMFELGDQIPADQRCILAFLCRPE